MNSLRTSTRTLNNIRTSPARLIFFTIVAVLSVVGSVEGQTGQAPRLAILPFSSNGVDTAYVQTAESILRTELGKLSSMDIVSAKRTREAVDGTSCIEPECAVEIGKRIEASQVAACQLSALGEKIVVQYLLVDVQTGKKLLIDQATVARADELDILMKRVAQSIVNLESVETNARVGTILPSEAEEPPRKASRNNFGLSVGYLFPQNGYDDGTRSLILDGRFDHEVNDFAIGMLLGIRQGFAMNVYGEFLASRSDFCPYAGIAMGFHWVSHEVVYNIERRSDGFQVGVNAGIRILHTYDFQVVFNLEYIATMNAYDDQAIVFTIGVL